MKRERRKKENWRKKIDEEGNERKRTDEEGDKRKRTDEEEDEETIKKSRSGMKLRRESRGKSK